MTDLETVKRLEPDVLPAHAVNDTHREFVANSHRERYCERRPHGMPTDAAARKGIPIFSGLLKYFPHACAAVAQLSRIGNDQHNPGQPLHWAKHKSTDEPDCVARHLTDFAVNPEHRDPDGVLAAVKIAWRALANLERLHDAGHDIFAVENHT